jgi:hypothetical protein
VIMAEEGKEEEAMLPEELLVSGIDMALSDEEEEPFEAEGEEPATVEEGLAEEEAGMSGEADEEATDRSVEDTEPLAVEEADSQD